MSVRKARRDEIGWINEKYAEVEFLPSDFDREIIAIAEAGGNRAGLGRLVRYAPAVLELSGMYVFEPFRKLGLARQIVQFLVAQVQKGETLYCIPFVPLLSFYKEFGFQEPQGEIPEAVLKKFRFCKEKYPTDTALLVLR